MTTRTMNTSCGNQRDGVGKRTGISSNTGEIDEASGSAIATAATTKTTITPISIPATKTRTTITSDPGILCFHHCNVKVFCFTLPHICPQCKTPLDTQHPNGMKSKRQTKNKKKTTNTNDANNANTKGQNQYKNNNHNSSSISKNSIYTKSIDNNHDTVDGDQLNAFNGNNGNEEDHQDNDYNDNDYDNDNDDDDDDNEDFDTPANSIVSHIMATRLLPFRLPYPFVRANQYPCAIVLRPTTGDFLNDYNNTTDLHIAVTTSTGCVVEFDRHGLRRHRTDNMSDWCQSLLVGDVPEPWYDYWDQVLFEICQQPDKWTVSHYHEDKHNCYTFVLTFLQALTYDKLSDAAKSKTTFCEKYIVPRTTTAGKYISLYRKLRDTGIYVHPTNHHHNKLRHSSSYGKGGNKQHQQQMQEQQQHQHQQYSNKFNNSTIVVASATNKSVMQQQQLHQHHQQKQHHHSNHHYSIISRPHSTLCTIEE